MDLFNQCQQSFRAYKHIHRSPLLPFLSNALNLGVWVQARWWRVPLISCAPARGLRLLEWVLKSRCLPSNVKNMHLFPKCQNNSGHVIAFVWKGLSGNASELGLVCSWPRNQPWKEDIVPTYEGMHLRTRGRGRQASRHTGSHLTIVGRGI